MKESKYSILETNCAKKTLRSTQPILRCLLNVLKVMNHYKYSFKDGREGL